MYIIHICIPFHIYRYLCSPISPCTLLCPSPPGPVCGSSSTEDEDVDPTFTTSQTSDHRDEAPDGMLDAVQSLPSYVQRSTMFVILVPPLLHSDLGTPCDFSTWLKRGRQVYFCGDICCLFPCCSAIHCCQWPLAMPMAMPTAMGGNGWQYRGN